MTNQRPQHDKFHVDDTNEVVDFVDKLKTGWMSWGDWLLGAMLVASASFFAYTYYTRHQNTVREQAFHDLANSDSPDVLAAISQKATYGTVGAQAALRAGDLFLKKAELETHADKTKELLTKAGNMYQSVEANAALPMVFRANALLGLASVNETQGRWDEAEAAYKKVIARTDDTLPNLKTLAQTRLDLLPVLKQPVAFGDEPAPEPETTSSTEIPAQKPAVTPAEKPTPATATGPTDAPPPAAPKGLEAPLQ